MRRAAKIVLIAIATILAVVVIAVVVITGTSPGHDFVRKRALAILSERANGIVRIGDVSGNLLTGITLADVSISDSSGTPLFVAERASARYDLVSFARKKVVLTSVTLVRPLVVLDRPPGGEWNFKRIFPGDTTQQDTTLGFGDWITFRDGHRCAVSARPTGRPGRADTALRGRIAADDGARLPPARRRSAGDGGHVPHGRRFTLVE
jgi:uncharacterized protein involved in outer membrane biogenesis